MLLLQTQTKFEATILKSIPRKKHKNCDAIAVVNSGLD